MPNVELEVKSDPVETPQLPPVSSRLIVGFASQADVNRVIQHLGPYITRYGSPTHNTTSHSEIIIPYYQHDAVFRACLHESIPIQRMELIVPCVQGLNTAPPVNYGISDLYCDETLNPWLED
jgi:hypothetical protein